MFFNPMKSQHQEVKWQTVIGDVGCGPDVVPDLVLRACLSIKPEIDARSGRCAHRICIAHRSMVDYSAPISILPSAFLESSTFASRKTMETRCESSSCSSGSVSAVVKHPYQKSVNFPILPHDTMDTMDC